MKNNKAVLRFATIHAGNSLRGYSDATVSVRGRKYTYVSRQGRRDEITSVARQLSALADGTHNLTATSANGDQFPASVVIRAAR